MTQDIGTSSLPSGEVRTSTVRLNYYPTQDPLNTQEQQSVTTLGDMALHLHTDPSILTLLLQDMHGGLQTLSKAGWIDVPPQADTIVVNLGDAMQVWTNDEYVTAVHRVVPRTTKPRLSTPFFFNPRNNAKLVPLAGLSHSAPHYRAFTWGDYIRNRVEGNFTNLGADNIQINRYRIA